MDELTSVGDDFLVSVMDRESEQGAFLHRDARLGKLEVFKRVLQSWELWVDGCLLELQEVCNVAGLREGSARTVAGRRRTMAESP